MADRVASGTRAGRRNMPEEGGIPTKQERLKEIFRRMGEAAPCSSLDTAYALLCETMVAVEDEMSGLPNEPERWMELPRLFPPRADRAFLLENYGVKRLDSLRHVTYIAENGAIEIRSIRVTNGRVKIHFSKKGIDGRSLSEMHPQFECANP